MNSWILSLPKEKNGIIKALQEAQKREGYVSNEIIIELSNYFDIPIVEIEGILSFYTQFKRVKPGKFTISVCDGTACHIKGAPLVAGWVSEMLKIKEGETDEKGVFSLETVACLGCCSLAPVVSINGKVFGNLTRKTLLGIIRKYQKEGAEND